MRRTAPFLGAFYAETGDPECGWRPEPESNRRARICSPLRNHSAIGPKEGRCTPFRELRARVKPAPVSLEAQVVTCRSARKLHSRSSFDEQQLARRQPADKSDP